MEHGNPNETYSMVMLASIAGLVGMEKTDDYVASKHGVNGIMKSAALEFRNT